MTSPQTTSTLDTVEHAAATPDQPQPFRELGLKDDEYARIREILGRRPTDAELAMYSVMWSEHCSYKSSKVHLRYFGETTTDEMRSAMLAGIGENAGVVDIGDGWAVTFKVESHNHPSYVEPYQGAATGVGGIVRDIMAMGARPVAVMDQLRFGAADAPDTRRVARRRGARRRRLRQLAGPAQHRRRDGVRRVLRGQPAGQRAVRRGAAQGGPAPGVRVGHRQQDHPVRRAHRPRRHRRGFGAGVGHLRRRRVRRRRTRPERSCRRFRWATRSRRRCSSSAAWSCTPPAWWSASRTSAVPDCPVPLPNLASAGDGGMAIELDKVPLRAANMTPAEVLSSESQERMCAVVTAGERRRVHGGVPQVGRAGHRHRRGDRRRSAAHHLARRDRRRRAAAHRRARGAGVPASGGTPRHPGRADRRQFGDSCARPATGDELRATLLALLGSPHLCSRAFITEQYDRYVRGNTVLAEHADGGVLRIDEETGRGIAVSTDASGRYTQLDPYAGAQLALAEAYRNVAVTGATPVAVTNCLNFGSPEDPGVMWQFCQAVRGLADGCAALGIPVTGGNVSFYNQTGSTAILPTPVVGVLGVFDDVSRRIPTDFGAEPGETLILLGDTRDEFDGSIWAQVTADHLGGRTARGGPGAGASCSPTC